MKMASSPIVSLLIIALTIGIFALDLVTPLGWADGFLYLIPLILLLFQSPHYHHLIGFAALGSGLIILGWVFSPPGGAIGAVTYNRTMGIALLWITALFLRHRKQVEETLERKVEERTADLQQAFNSLEKDITERKRVEKALRQSEEQLRLLMGCANDAILYINLNGAIQWVSHHAEVMTGWPSDELIGHSIMVLLSPIAAAQAEARLAAVRRGQAVPALVELEFLRPDGVPVVTEANIASVQEQGRVVGHLLVARDVTERKRAEEALKESEAFKNRILQSSPDCIKVLDLEGRLLFMNKGGQELMEIRNITPFLGSSWFEFWKGEDRQRASAAVAAARANEAGRFIGFCPTATGKPKWWDVLITPLLDVSGAPDKLLSISRDVTERKQVDEALRRSGRRLNQLLEDRERISQDLHDNIIQMLYAIGLGLEESQRLIGDDSKAAAQNVSTAVKALNAVIRDVRSYIAWSEPKVSDGRQLKAAIERLARTMEGTHLLHFRLKVDQEAADRLTPEQASHVLYIAREAMSNSLRHSHAHDGIVALEARDGNICLVVADVGEGFDTTNIERYGQGLHNMAERAQKLDARLQIVSEPGLGVRITLNIPMVKKRASAGV